MPKGVRPDDNQEICKAHVTVNPCDVAAFSLYRRETSGADQSYGKDKHR
ncbi:MAG: hypothetical protein HY731_07850 [Candidatus Tectomicrobia bacterium]|nr:hypothetical protein [Candidatus Tectomicrobia bacterium]